MENRKEESHEKEYISYIKYFNNYNIIWMSKEKKEVSTYEQDRGVQYILDNVELVEGSEIKKIKFLSFENQIQQHKFGV